VRLLLTADVGIGAHDPVKLALVIERQGFRPRALQEGDILPDSAVARIVVGEVPIARLVRVVHTRDQMDGCAPTRQLVEGGKLACGHGRGHKARPVGEQKLEPTGHRRRMRRSKIRPAHSRNT